MRSTTKRRRGFAIVSAIFILVVLAALGAFIMSISTSQQIGSALDVQGARAYQAARAGIEWGLYRQLQDASCAATTSFSPAAGTLSSFTVVVTCSASTPVSGEPVIHTLTSTACSTVTCPNTSPGNFYVERRLAVAF